MREADMKCQVAVRLLSPPLGHILLPTASGLPFRGGERGRPKPHPGCPLYTLMQVWYTGNGTLEQNRSFAANRPQPSSLESLAEVFSSGLAAASWAGIVAPRSTAGEERRAAFPQAAGLLSIVRRASAWEGDEHNHAV